MKLLNYLFPALIFTLSLSMIKIGDFNLNTPFGWLTILILSFILFKTMKNKLIIITLILLMVMFRIMAMLQPGFYIAYDMINNGLYFLAGLIMFSINDKIFYKQILFIICLSAPIMFLQMAGVSWVHYHTYGQELAIANGFTDTLFKSGPIFSLSHAQFRPPGILWSNQFMGLLIIFIAAYLLFHQRRLRWFHYFIISFVVVLSTSYYVYFSYIIILVSILLFRSKYIKNRKLKILTCTILAVIFFNIIFPGINDLLWDKVDILNKVWIRLVDLRFAGLDINSIPFISNLETIVGENRQNQLMSNIKGSSDGYNVYTMFGLLYSNKIIALIVIIIFTRFIIKIIRSTLYEEPLKYSKIYVLFGLMSFVSINPHGDSSLFAFLLAFPLTMYFPNFIKNQTLLTLIK